MASEFLTSDFLHWNRAIGDIIQNPHAETLPEQLGHALRLIVPFDVVLIEIFSQDSVPIMFYDDVARDRHKVVIENYLTGAYLLDPFYLAFLEDKSPGGYMLEELGPDDFLNSEYYQQYYRAVDCGTEFGYLFPLTSKTGACISVSRLEWNPKFSEEDAQKLRAVEPIVRSAFSIFWRERKDIDVSGRESATEFHRKITAAVSNFGKSVLTSREAQITQLILRGHSSKSVAEKLEISAATVNTHRHRIYDKLDITSQAELFSVFIDSLSCSAHAEVDADPLEAYQSRKND